MFAGIHHVLPAMPPGGEAKARAEELPGISRVFVDDPFDNRIEVLEGA